MDRERLTITLKSDLLHRLDEVVDGVKIRNRSHAIEYLLSSALTLKVTQAVILSGGPGVKMRPLTYELPKPLIPLSGRPLIEYTIELLRENGVRNIILAVGHLGEKIKQEIGNGRKHGVKITYSQENKPLGSAGALRQAQSLITSQTFLVFNGDILAEINLTEMIQFHREQGCLATMALSSVGNTVGYGTVLLRGGKIVKFLKRNQKDRSFLVDAGIYVFEPAVFDYIPQKGKSYFDTDVFPRLAQQGELAGFSFEGKWFEVSTPKNYERAIKAWRRK